MVKIPESDKMAAKPNMSVVVDVTQCAKGGVVGVMREWPIVAQADTVEGLEAKLLVALTEHLMHDREDLTERISMKIAA